MSIEVPVGWAVQALGEVAHLIMGQSPPSSAVSTECNGLAFIQGNAEFGARHPTPRHFASTTPKVVQAGDILLSVRAPVGEVNVAEGPLCIGRGVGGVRANGCDPDFLFYAIGGLSSTFARLSQGSTFDAINGKELRAIELLIPPLNEQRQIAEVLRSVDEAMGKAAEVLSQTREARAHQLESLMALPGEMRRVREVCRLSGGYGFPIRFQGKRVGLYPFAKVSDMNRPGNETELTWAENRVDLEDLRLLRAKPFPVGTTFFPKVGATLLTNKRRIAACEIIVDNNVMGAVATDIDPWFLFYAFSTIDMADYVQPGAVPSVNQGTIGQIMIPVPSREIQAKYVGLMQDLDGGVKAQRAALEKLASAKAALSGDLLSGRVRVPA
jgi:type I restriction enzyme, S subunit